MNFSQKNINLILLTLFGIGVVFSIFNLALLPGTLERVSIKIDFNVLEQIRPVIRKVLMMVGLTFLTGFLLLSSYVKSQVVKKRSEKHLQKEKSDTLSLVDEKQQEDDHHNSLEKELMDVKKKIEQSKGLEKRANKYITAVCDKLEASQGLLYLVKKNKKERSVEMLAGYAVTSGDSEKLRYEFGEGLVGQVAKEDKVMSISDIPEGYIKILSGLGSASPGHLLIVPIKQKGEVVAVVELASFSAFKNDSEALIKQAFTNIEKEIPVKAQKKTTDSKKPETAKTSKK